MECDILLPDCSPESECPYLNARFLMRGVLAYNLYFVRINSAGKFPKRAELADDLRRSFDSQSFALRSSHSLRTTWVGKNCVGMGYFSETVRFTVALSPAWTLTFFSQVRGGPNTGRSTRLSVSTSKLPSW